ncbi:MAG: DUF2339 domain-containing protein [Holophaga sp.]|nr:DUF2339 domain-containing protein [Holophaga sp.]
MPPAPVPPTPIKPEPVRIAVPSAQAAPPVAKVRPLPSVPATTPVVKAPRRNLENFLGTQLFLKVGVAILVIGVVFAMGMVFQLVGPIGKVLMGYGTGLGLLGTGMAFERKERFCTFGQALIAGAWGILYFVTFAAGFLEASQVIHTKVGAILALLLAGGAAVGYSLRYRREWTTIAAFLLIHLSLGIAAYHLAPAQNLVATLIVALAIAVLVWRTGWVKLLGLGVPATWASLALWMIPREAGELALLPATLLVALAFQAATLLMKVEEEDFSWLGLAQIANFLVPFGLCLRESLPSGMAWMWALGFGLAHVGFAFAHGRKRRHGLFLLTATEALVALAFVTPLRLGLHHELTPLMRLVGLEMLLAAGIFLRERYFRILAYSGFGITFLELLAVRLRVPGPGRTLLLGAAVVLFLLNALLLRTRWREACQKEIPEMAWAFSLAGTLCLAILVGLELPLRWLPPAYAGMAVVWVMLALSRGLGDLVVEATALSGATGVSLLVLNFNFVPPVPGRVLAASLAGGTLAITYVLSRLWANPRLEPKGSAFFQGLFSFLALGCGVLLALRELPAPWPPPVLVASGLIVLWLGLWLSWRELTVEGIALGPLALLMALPNLETSGGTSLYLPKRAWMLGLLAAGALGKEMLLRVFGRTWPWAENAKGTFVGAYGLAGALFLVILVFAEVPARFVAGSLTTLGLIWLLWAHWRISLLRFGTALGFTALGFLAMATHAWEIPGAMGRVPWRVLAIGMALIPALLSEWKLRSLRCEFTTDAHELVHQIGKETLHWLAGAVLVLVSSALAVLVFAEMPPRFIAVSLVLLGGVYFLWARHCVSTLRCYLSAGFLLLGFIALGTHAWWLEGFLGVFPARLAAVGMTLVAAYGIQYLYQRASMTEPQSELGEQLPAGTLEFFAAATLLACSGVLGALIKMEALAHDKNLLVAPAWALLGVLYLERGQALVISKAWRIQGHLWMGAALLHFLAVNLMQTGDLGNVSLRLVTGIPMLGLYLYTYLSWESEGKTNPEPVALQWSYFYALQLVVALLVLYEIHRAWVLPVWALQGLLSLGWGLHRETPHWLRAALILAMAALVRGLGTNLYFRDELGALRLNWITVPLAVVLLLAGYVVLNRHRDDQEAQGSEGFGAGYNRYPWFLAQALLLFAFIWMEVSGTDLTVWLSGYGLGMVALGFLLQERVARLTGLGMLSACILKLFIYDLRGLSGLPRVLSFILLGAVLIAVSYTYTRFKERLEKLL